MPADQPPASPEPTTSSDPSEARPADRTSPRGGAGGYRYVVEVYVDGERLECETNDAFWFCHDAQKGKSIRVWYRPGRPLLECHNPGTELMAAFMALAGIGLLLIR